MTLRTAKKCLQNQLSLRLLIQTGKESSQLHQQWFYRWSHHQKLMPITKSSPRIVFLILLFHLWKVNYLNNICMWKMCKAWQKTTKYFTNWPIQMWKGFSGTVVNKRRCWLWFKREAQRKISRCIEGNWGCCIYTKRICVSPKIVGSFMRHKNVSHVLFWIKLFDSM